MRRAALVALAVLALLPAAAAADGDPASDVLLAQDVYYPYAPKVSKPMSTALIAVGRRREASLGGHEGEDEGVGEEVVPGDEGRQPERR